MEFIESSFVGLRSAFHVLESDTAKPRLLILPMVHIGDLSFYDEVSKRLAGCQTIIYEGVPGFRAKLLAQAYRFAARRKSLNLVTQSNEIDISVFDAHKIHADVGSSRFGVIWRTLPWLERIALPILAPLYGIWMYLFSTRESIATGRSTDSLSNAHEIQKYDDSSIAIREVMLGKRDEYVVTQIDAYLEKCQNTEETAAILFGAAHMPAIVSHLSLKHGYRSQTAEWVNVIAVT